MTRGTRRRRCGYRREHAGFESTRGGVRCVPSSVPPRRPASLDWSSRAGCLLAAAACLAVLVIGFGLSPDARGFGTHERLGLPACGWLAATGWPCPTCGMTTSVSLASHGRWGASLATQPFGLLLAVTLATAFWPLAWSGATGSRMAPALTKLVGLRTAWVVLGLGLAAWAYKAAIVRFG